MGFLGGLARAAIPGVTGLIQGQMAGKDRQRQQEMEALQAMLLQERLNEIPVARKERAEDRSRQSMLDAEQSGDRAFNRKRQSRLDKRVPTQIVDRLGPDGQPGTFAVPEYGGPPMDTGLKPIPGPAPSDDSWQIVDDYSGAYGPPGQKVQINRRTGEVRPVRAQGRAPTPGSGMTAAMRQGVAENNALIADIDRTIAELRANPSATGLAMGVIGRLPLGEYAMAGADPSGDAARQGVGIQRSKVLHDFIGGAQTRVELANLKDALPERGFSAQTNIQRLEALKQRAMNANAAMQGAPPPSIARPGGETAQDPAGWAGGDPEKLRFLRENGLIP